jgi:transposase
MANFLKMDLIETIRVMHQRGWSKRRIARELGIDRQTVRKYLQELSKSPPISTPGSEPADSKSPPISTPGDLALYSPPPPPGKPGRPSVCQPHAELITQMLHRGLTAQRIYQDLRDQVAFTGSYQAVKRFVRQFKRQSPEPIWRVEVQPGEEVQVDFAAGPPIVGEQGRRRCWILRAILSYSRKGYSEAVWRQSTEHFIRAVENAFRHFGGSTKILNVDNLKAAVVKADWIDPELNPKLVEFCRHYGTALLPCRPRTPEHKGKTERSIAYVKSNALAGREFSSLSALNEFLQHWERTVADVRVHGTTCRQVSALFAEEKKFLLPLPQNLFPCFEEAPRSVHRDSYVEVARAYYAVPPEYIARKVWVRWDGREVRIFNGRGEQIALHRRLEPGQFSRALGVAGGHGSLDRHLQYWLGRCQALGGPCGQWAQGLLQREGPVALRRLMGLVQLNQKHSFKALNQACAAALSCGAWRLRDVRRLLQSHQVQTHFEFAQNHPLIRDLAEYGLFIKTQHHE